MFGGIADSATAWRFNQQQFKHQMALLRDQHEMESADKDTARQFLSDKSYTDGGFDTLKNHLGDFEDKELRKILVYAGAVSVFRAPINSS